MEELSQEDEYNYEEEECNAEIRGTGPIPNETEVSYPPRGNATLEAQRGTTRLSAIRLVNGK